MNWIEIAIWLCIVAAFLWLINITDWTYIKIVIRWLTGK